MVVPIGYYVTLQKGIDPSVEIACAAKNTDAIKAYVAQFWAGYNIVAIRPAGEDMNTEESGAHQVHDDYIWEKD